MILYLIAPLLTIYSSYITSIRAFALIWMKKKEHEFLMCITAFRLFAKPHNKKISCVCCTRCTVRIVFNFSFNFDAFAEPLQFTLFTQHTHTKWSERANERASAVENVNHYAYIKWREKKINHTFSASLFNALRFFLVLSLFCSLSLFIRILFLFVHFASLFACSHSFYQFQCSSHPRPCTYRLTFFRCFGRFVCFVCLRGASAFGIFSTSLLLGITVPSLVLYP